ncbi:hypothetical protein AB0P17_30105 [Streptomyces sp. NPDC088124]|uniref:hypothetical protein n=1 Tax=Streptomyces sp. NPDC088124 TaxID=3154654 RepID=UPI0034229BE1
MAIRESSADERPVTRGWAGCLAVVGGFLTGAVVWVLGAAPGVRGGFEGERDLSLLYVELPLLLFGMPALALAAWALAAGVLRVREGLAALMMVGVLALAAWAGAEWLDVRTAPFTRGGPW